MSPQFQHNLDQREWLIPAMDGVFVAALIAATAVGLLVKRTRLAFGIVVGIAISTMVLADFTFGWWWSSLRDAVQTPDDQEWIFDHDGGRLIVGLESLIKSAGILIAGGLVVWIRWTASRFQRSETIQHHNEGAVTGWSQVRAGHRGTSIHDRSDSEVRPTT